MVHECSLSLQGAINTSVRSSFLEPHVLGGQAVGPWCVCTHVHPCLQDEDTLHVPLMDSDKTIKPLDVLTMHDPYVPLPSQKVTPCMRLIPFGSRRYPLPSTSIAVSDQGDPNPLVGNNGLL